MIASASTAPTPTPMNLGTARVRDSFQLACRIAYVASSTLATSGSPDRSCAATTRIARMPTAVRIACRTCALRARDAGRRSTRIMDRCSAVSGAGVVSRSTIASSTASRWADADDTAATAASSSLRDGSSADAASAERLLNRRARSEARAVNTVAASAAPSSGRTRPLQRTSPSAAL